jgi:hypothetical protein
MSSRTIVRSMRRGLNALLVVALCVSQVSVIWAGNFRNGAVGGVSINVDGVVRNAEVSQREAMAKRLRDEFTQPDGDINKAVQIRKVSLKKLEAACQHYLAENNGQLPDEVKYLGGLLRIQYVLVYPEQNDIVLAGPAEGWKVDAQGNVVGITTGQPVIQLDDLLVALRTVRTARNGGISCSIDPTQEGYQKLTTLLQNQRRGPNVNIGALEAKMKEAFGPQQIKLNGIPTSSHMARVLVAADYRMKRLAMNLDKSPINGMPSYIEMIQNSGKQAAKVNPRWWLACNYKPLAKTDDNLAWELRGQGVKTLTEEDVIGDDGTVERTGKANAAAQKWANTMTEKYEELAASEPIFAELRNVMDLCVVAAVIDEHELMNKAGCSLPLLSGDQSDLVTFTWYTPRTVPPQCSFLRTRAGWVVTASGGVQIASFQVANEFQVDNSVKQIRDRAAGNKDTWWWN